MKDIMKIDDQPINTPERFERFKQECIDAISKLTFDDDPHIICIVSKGHDDATKLACACPGFLFRTGMDLMRSASGAEVVSPLILGKGGEA